MNLLLTSKFSGEEKKMLVNWNNVALVKSTTGEPYTKEEYSEIILANGKTIHAKETIEEINRLLG